MTFTFMGRTFVGLMFIFAGLVIIWQPDIIQYALAAILIFSGTMMLIGSFSISNSSKQEDSGTKEAEFRRLED